MEIKNVLSSSSISGKYNRNANMIDVSKIRNLFFQPENHNQPIYFVLSHFHCCPLNVTDNKLFLDVKKW